MPHRLRARAEIFPHEELVVNSQGSALSVQWHAAWDNGPLFEAEMTQFLYQRFVP